MNRRSILVGLGSVVAGVLLVVLLIRIGNIHLAASLSVLRTANGGAVAKLVLLNGCLILLSTEKWLNIDKVLRAPGDRPPQRVTAFFVTSLGMALGLLLPVQVGLAISRTASTHFLGKAVKRGTGGTLLEQGFDLLVVLVFAGASFLTWLCQGRLNSWLILVLLLNFISLLAMDPGVWLLRLAAVRFSGGRMLCGERRRPALVARATAFCSRSLHEIREGGLLESQLARRLFLLSLARFFVLIQMAVCSAEAVRIQIPFWQFGAAMPFAAIANLLAVTPGGIGLNELASVGALHLFGIPLSAASQWALTNRLLVTASCFAVTGLGALLFSAERIARLSGRLLSGAREGKGIAGC